jgi:sugar O-acyltransferase (sialic acid O-acetyltransferase NeuD family)
MLIKSPVLIVGAGGHARVVVDALVAAQPDIAVFVRDDRAALEGVPLLGRPVRTPIAWNDPGADSFHVAIGHNATRRRFFEEGMRQGRRPQTVCHPAATVSRFAEIGAGTFVAAGAVVAPGAVIGAGVILNHGAVVDHDCAVGGFSHVAPGAALGGGVRVGMEVLVGAGAVILPGRSVGDGAVIGAGAVVSRDVPAGATVAGIPARSFPTK